MWIRIYEKINGFDENNWFLATICVDVFFYKLSFNKNKYIHLYTNSYGYLNIKLIQNINLYIKTYI